MFSIRDMRMAVQGEKHFDSRHSYFTWALELDAERCFSGTCHGAHAAVLNSYIKVLLLHNLDCSEHFADQIEVVDWM